MIKKALKKSGTRQAKLESNQKRLYQALLFICQFQKIEDLKLLNSKDFLKLCEVSAVDFHGVYETFNEGFLKEQDKIHSAWMFQHLQDLNFKDSSYGEIIFHSSQKFTKQKKNFLKKISDSIASSIYFIEQKERLALMKKQWGSAFDSLPQAFCITDKQFKILRSNQAFQKLFKKEKSQILSQNLFQLFPFKVTPIYPKENSSSFLIQGEQGEKKVYWELSCKNLYLKEEQIEALLFLIKDVSQETLLSARISAKAKEKEMGWIKGSLAHELNNPIAGIKALLSLIEREIPEDHKENLKQMQKSMDVCHEVIKNLLSISKQDSL